MQKNVNIGGVWSVVELTESEKDNVLSGLIESNLKELLRCMDALKSKDISDDFKKWITGMLFEKQATASFTALSDALDSKISEMRNSYKRPELPKEKQTEIEKLVETELKTKPEIQKPSLIDLAFSPYPKGEDD
jgi:hypothetical protein